MSRDAQRCDKVGDIVSKWNSCDAGRNRATCAWIRIAQLRELRVDGDVRGVDIADLATNRRKRRKLGLQQNMVQDTSVLGQPIRFTSGETSDRFAVCRRKGQ